MNNNILLSVIIPVYNCERFLEDCLSSLTRQNFTKDKYEVIVINDGSSDNSQKIINNYCDKYDYFISIEKENSGVAASRNIGIRTAKGKYITFVDDDDLVMDNIYIPIIEIVEKENLNGFYFDVSTKLEDLDYDKNRRIEYKKCDKSSSPSVWNVIYKKEQLITHNIFFDEEIRQFNEDYLFNIIYTINCSNVGVTNKKLYYYRRIDNNVSVINQLREGDSLQKKRHYQATLKSCEKLFNYGIENKLLDNKFFDFSLSNMVTVFMWGGATKSWTNPYTVLNDLKKYNLSNKNIKYKIIEGDSFKLRLKSELQYMFRFKLFYFLFSYFNRFVIILSNHKNNK